MKPRRYLHHVAPLSTPAHAEPIVQLAGPILAFAIVGQSHKASRSPRSRNRKSPGNPAQSHDSNRTEAARKSGPDSSFTFSLSPSWLPAIAATSAGELFENIRKVVGVMATEGRLSAIHSSLGKVIKHREYPFLEIPMMELLPENLPNRLPGSKAARGLALYFEARYECRDGSMRWLGWNIFSRPREQRLDCVARDITRAKSSAAVARRMQQMFTLSRDLFCVLDARGRFQMANPAFEELLGAPPESLVGKSFAAIVSERDRRRAVSSLADLSQGSALFVARCGPGGRRVAWKAVAASPKNLVYCVGRDVTDLRVVTGATQRNQQRVINVAQLSNDINNPLEAILNLLFLLKKRRLPARDQGRYIAIAEEQVFRIAKALGTIL